MMCFLDLVFWHIQNVRIGSVFRKGKNLSSKSFYIFLSYKGFHKMKDSIRNFHEQTDTYLHSYNSQKVSNFYKVKFCILV